MSVREVGIAEIRSLKVGVLEIGARKVGAHKLCGACFAAVGGTFEALSSEVGSGSDSSIAETSQITFELPVVQTAAVDPVEEVKGLRVRDTVVIC